MCVCVCVCVHVFDQSVGVPTPPLNCLISVQCVNYVAICFKLLKIAIEEFVSKTARQR